MINEIMPDKKTDNTSQSLPRLAYTMEETAGFSALLHNRSRLLKRGLFTVQRLRHKLIPMTEIQRFLRESMES